jgi:hypothetical protein
MTGVPLPLIMHEATLPQILRPAKTSTSTTHDAGYDITIGLEGQAARGPNPSIKCAKRQGHTDPRPTSAQHEAGWQRLNGRGEGPD